MDPKLCCAIILVTVFVSFHVGAEPARELRDSVLHRLIKRSGQDEHGGQHGLEGIFELGPEITEKVLQCVHKILSSVNLDDDKAGQHPDQPGPHPDQPGPHSDQPNPHQYDK